MSGVDVMSVHDYNHNGKIDKEDLYLEELFIQESEEYEQERKEHPCTPTEDAIGIGVVIGIFIIVGLWIKSVFGQL